jgi:hypothetical protein
MDQAADEHNQLVSDDDDKQFNIHIKNLRNKHGNMASTEYEPSSVQQHPDLCLNHNNIHCCFPYQKREACYQMMVMKCLLNLFCMSNC